MGNTRSGGPLLKCAGLLRKREGHPDGGIARGKPLQAIVLSRAAIPARSISAASSLVEPIGTISCWDPILTVLDGRPCSTFDSRMTAAPGTAVVGPSEITATS